MAMLCMFMVVATVHELSHVLFAAGRLKGMFLGFVRVSGRWFIDFLFFGVGFVVYPPRKLDCAVPQIAVPGALALLTLVGVMPSPWIGIGVALNLTLGVLDFSNLATMDRYRNVPWEKLKELTAKKLCGYIVWVR
ncbi:MAG: hypothetical protein QXT64_01840 [Desulfurococcaceae archaeon]